MLGKGDIVEGGYILGERVRELGPFVIHEGRGPRGERITVQVLQPQYAGFATVVPSLKIAAARLPEGVHPHVAGYHACVESQETVAMVSEASPTNTLADALRVRGRLPADQATLVALHIAEALAFIHGRDVTHGALSPSAVVVGAGGLDRLRVANAGLAEALRGQPYPGAVDDPYAAPERREGGDATPQSDIYSVGAILYRMLTGQTPAPGSVSARDVDPEVDPELDTIVARCLAERSEGRYASAEDLRRALMRVAEPLLQSRGEVPARDETRVRPLIEHPAWPVVIGILYAVLLPLLIILPPVIVYASWRHSAPREAIVPDVVGLKVDQARSVVHERGLVLAVVDEVYDPKIPAGQVIWAKPQGGKVVKEGRVINVRVSRGARAVEVPDVTSIDLDSAKKLLEEAKLKAGKIERAPSDILVRNAVLSQSPKPGRRIAEGEGVDLLVSSGPAKLPSPKAEGPEKTGRVVLTVPRGPRTQRVQIRIKEGGVERTVYDALHEPGDRINEQVRGRGDLEIGVYVDGNLAKKEKL